MAFCFVIQAKSSANGALGGSDMERLLQSLYVETRAGFFFTKFCEQTGNKVETIFFFFFAINYIFSNDISPTT